jgi:hypothetical protein
MIVNAKKSKQKILFFKILHYIFARTKKINV